MILTLCFLTSSTKDDWPKFVFEIRRDHRKNFPWAPRLWVGRRWEAILGYISKNRRKIKFMKQRVNTIIWQYYMLINVTLIHQCDIRTFVWR